MNFKKVVLYIKLTFFVPKKKLNINNNELFLIRERNNRKIAISYIDKKKYMKSKEWQLMQKIWLYEKGYRCQMFPFLVLGQHKSKKSWWNNSIYRKYAIHHINRKAYEQLGMEELDKNVIVLSKFAHNWVYHYLLSFGKRKVSDQKLVKFANPIQQIMNYWCFINKWMKLIIVIILFYILS